jgi:hypothetical protein
MALRRKRPSAREWLKEPFSLGGLRQAALGLGSVLLTVALIVTVVAALMLYEFGAAEPLVTVPDVVGMPSEQAQERLDAARLEMKIVSHEYTAKVKEGAVIASSPYAGKVVRAGREVRVTVSRGHRTAKVPKLKGLTLTEATEKLSQMDLQVGEQERRASAEPADLVLGQVPPAATVLPRKQRVNLIVSGGKDFGVYRAGERTFIFRQLKIIVPQGKVLQLVSVDVEGEDMDKSFLERLCRPGEVVRVDLYGPEGARVRVRIEDEMVFSERLRGNQT